MCLVWSPDPCVAFTEVGWIILLLLLGHCIDSQSWRPCISPLFPGHNILMLCSLFILAFGFCWKINPLSLTVSKHQVMWTWLILCKLCGHNKLVNYLQPFIFMTTQSAIANLFHVVRTWIWIRVWAFQEDCNFLNSCPVNLCGCGKYLLSIPSMISPNLFSDLFNEHFPWDFSPEEGEPGQIHTSYHFLLPFVFFQHSSRSKGSVAFVLVW